LLCCVEYCWCCFFCHSIPALGSADDFLNRVWQCVHFLRIRGFPITRIPQTRLSEVSAQRMRTGWFLPLPILAGVHGFNLGEQLFQSFDVSRASELWTELRVNCERSPQEFESVGFYDLVCFAPSLLDDFLRVTWEVILRERFLVSDLRLFSKQDGCKATTLTFARTHAHTHTRAYVHNYNNERNTQHM
jgi:hypothetical protein